MGNIVIRVQGSIIGRKVKPKVQHLQPEFDSMEMEIVKIKEEKEFDASTVANDEDNREADFDASTDANDEDNREVDLDGWDEMSGASSWDSGRISEAKTFEHTGVDLCGPFNIRASKLKFEKVIKVWVAVFVCLATKAVHLEVCTEQSKDNFLASFTRFTSRRGCPRRMYSDNGTNFVASGKAMKGWQQAKKEVSHHLAIQEIEWNYIPKLAPRVSIYDNKCNCMNQRAGARHLKLLVNDSCNVYVSSTTI